MRSTDILQSEHRVIEQVLTCLERIAQRGLKAGKLDEMSARQAIEFLQTFADRCHHGKEENHLFPVMEARGFSRDKGPTGVMMHEHELGRKLIHNMNETLPGAAAGQEAALHQFVQSAGEYVDLLRQHISKEDHCLFTMAGNVLSAEDDARLVERFADSELHDVPAGAHEHFLAIAQDLAMRYDVPHAKPCCGCAGH
jgi:hemerythrin-like domain-containing protein